MLKTYEINKEIEINLPENREYVLNFIEQNKNDTSCLYYSDYSNTSLSNLLRMLGFIFMVAPWDFNHFLIKKIVCYEKNFSKLKELYELLR